MLPAVQLDQLIDNPLSYHDKLEGFLRLLNAQEQESCERIDCHNIVEVSFNGLIELTDDRLCCIDGLETRLVLSFLSMHQS